MFSMGDKKAIVKRVHTACQHDLLPAEPEPKQHLVSIIEQATTEAEVVTWMYNNKVHRSELGARHTDGSTALISACRRGMAEVAKSLLAVSAPVHDVNDVGDTALHWASFKAAEVEHMVDVVEHLLAAGADPSAIGDCGNTPLHLAATCRSALVCRRTQMHQPQTSNLLSTVTCISRPLHRCILTATSGRNSTFALMWTSTCYPHATS